jgi:hypothetical protein
VKRKAILKQKGQSPARHCKILESDEARSTRLRTLNSESLGAEACLVKVNGLIKLGSNLGGRPRRRVVIAPPLVEDVGFIPGTGVRKTSECRLRRTVEHNLALFTAESLGSIPGEDEGLGAVVDLILFVVGEVRAEQQKQPLGLDLMRGCSEVRALSLSRFERRTIVTLANQLSQESLPATSYKKL